MTAPLDRDARIRPATVRDLPRLVEIETAASTLFPVGMLPVEMGCSNAEAEIPDAIQASLAWVADVSREGPVGFLAAKGFASSLHIVEMDVHPTFGRQGIGARLVEFAASRAHVLGYKDITLTTFRHIPWNAPFYARHGFEFVEAFDHYPHLEKALEVEASRGFFCRVAMSRRVL